MFDVAFEHLRLGRLTAWLDMMYTNQNYKHEVRIIYILH